MIHIGRIIEKAMENEEMGITSFAKKIGASRSSVYRIFDSPSIDTAILVKICEVLGKNFFEDYLHEVDRMLGKKTVRVQYNSTAEINDFLHGANLDPKLLKKLNANLEALLKLEKESSKRKK